MADNGVLHRRNLSALRVMFTSRCSALSLSASNSSHFSFSEADGMGFTAVVVSCLCGSVVAFLHFSILLIFLVIYVRYSLLLNQRASIDLTVNAHRSLHLFSVLCVVLSLAFFLLYVLLLPEAWCLAAHRAFHVLLIAVFVHHRWREYTKARSFKTLEERCTRVVLGLCLAMALGTTLAVIIESFRPPSPCAGWASYCFDAVECFVAAVLVSLLIRCVTRLRQISTTHDIRVSILLSLLSMGLCFLIPSILILTWDIGVAHMRPCSATGAHLSLLTFFILSDLALSLHSLIPSVYILHACMTQEMKFLCSRANSSTANRQSAGECSRFYTPPVPVHVFPALLPIFMDSVERSQAQSEVLLLQSVLWDSEDSIHSIASSGEPSSTCSVVANKFDK